MSGSRQSFRTALVIPQLNGGGAERAALTLAAHSRSQCVVIVERPGGDLADDPLAATAVVASPHPARRSRPVRVVSLRRCLERIRPHVVLSVLSPAVVAAAASSLRIPSMYWLQSPASAYVPTHPSGAPTRAGRLMLRALARPARGILGASPGLLREWEAAGVSDSKLRVLPNGLDLPDSADSENRRTGREVRQILAAGRLAPEKRHDLVISAFAMLLRRVPAHLTILGRGELLGDLEAHAVHLGVDQHVTFAGFATDPHEYMRNADLFVLGSDFEGFGNVLVEALSHGLPIVATDVPFGPRFILEGVQSAQLVPRSDADALGRAMGAALEGPADGALAEEARARARVFAISRTAQHFDRLAVAARTGEPLPRWAAA